MKYPICPKCGVELECDDTYDFEYDEDGMTLRQVGGCPRCGQGYQWEQSASFRAWESSDLREC